MQYNTSTSKTIVVSDDKGVSTTYTIPEKITTWQVIEFSIILADFTEKATDAGSALGNAVLAAVQSNLDMAQAAMALNDYSVVTGTNFFALLSKGSVEILRYLHSSKALAKVQAILYLKPGESSLTEEVFVERTALFMGAPIEGLKGAVQSFLFGKIESWKSTSWASQIFEIVTNLASRNQQTSASVPSMDATSTETSDGSVVSLTSLQTETSAESPLSSDSLLNEVLSS
jgi:hypothetical protein